MLYIPENYKKIIKYIFLSIAIILVIVFTCTVIFKSAVEALNPRAAKPAIETFIVPIVEVDVTTPTRQPITEDNYDYGSFKSYMDYRAITSPSSRQYQLQQLAVTDTTNGFRQLNNYYLVAVGSAYGKVGDALEVTLWNGNIFTAIVGDTKASKDTIDNTVHKIDGSVIEFIVDVDHLDNLAKKLGDISSLNNLDGGIKYINKIGYYDIANHEIIITID